MLFVCSFCRRPRSRDYELERKRLTPPIEDCDHHPLGALVTVSLAHDTVQLSFSSRGRRELSLVLLSVLLHAILYGFHSVSRDLFCHVTTGT